MDCITVDIHSCLVSELRVLVFFGVYSIFVKLENQLFALVSSLWAGGGVAVRVFRNANHCTGHFRQIFKRMHTALQGEQQLLNHSFFIFLLFLPPGNRQLIGDCTLDTS
jgi:hypothetical protein